jgi:hypothetical protein
LNKKTRKLLFALGFEFLRIDEIRTRSSCLHLDNISTNEQKFGISNL